MLDKLNLANSLLEGISTSIGIKPSLCTRIKHKNSPCVACHINCPTDAISVGSVGTTINLNHQKCTGCGICINVCPTETYYLRHNGYKELIDNCCRAIKSDGVLTVACNQVEDNSISNVAFIECIGIFNIVDLLLLYLKGARKIVFKHGSCTLCDSKKGTDILNKEIDLLKELSNIFEYLDGLIIHHNNTDIIIDYPKSFPIIRPVEKPKENPTVDRRGLFSFFTKNLKDTALKSASIMTPQKLDKKTTISFEQYVPEKRRMFIDVIMQLGNILSLEVATGRLFNSIKIDDDCIFCGMCVKFCNTGALAINDEKSEITFNPSKCVNCKLCEKSCLHNKLHYENTLNIKDFFSDILLAKRYWNSDSE